MQRYGEIKIGEDEAESRVRLLALNRPASRNAMSQTLVDECLHYFDTAAGDESIGATVLHGLGNGFCAGSDLAGLAAMDTAGRSAFEAASGLLARTMMAHPKPVLAAVHGFAVGGGLTLAAACDIVITSGQAKWSLPEVPIGLFPAWGLEQVTLRMGRAAARRLSWGIETLDGEAAARSGLADLVATAPLGAALDVARRLAVLPAAQSASVKRYFAETRSGEEADGEANALFMAACASVEAASCFARFVGNGD